MKGLNFEGQIDAARDSYRNKFENLEEIKNKTPFSNKRHSTINGKQKKNPFETYTMYVLNSMYQNEITLSLYEKYIKYLKIK